MVFLRRSNEELLHGGLHMKEIQKEDRKTIWIRALTSVSREGFSFAWFKLNPSVRELSGSVVPQAPLPLMTLNALQRAAVAISGSKLYVLGGLSSNRHPHDDVYIIDLDDNKNSDGSNSSSWIKGPSMLYPRANSSCVVVDDKIYVFGGLFFQTHEVMVPFGEVFDPTTSKWKALPQIPVDPDYSHGAGAYLVSVAAAATTTVAGGPGKRYILVHFGLSNNLMGYCVEDESWFSVDPNFRRICYDMVVVDDVMYNIHSCYYKVGSPILAYHLPTRRYLTVHCNLEVEEDSRLIYLGNNNFWLLADSRNECCFIEFSISKNSRGPELDSISITLVSSGKFHLDARSFDGFVAA